MIRKLSKSLLLFSLTAILASCSTSMIESKKIDYKTAGKLPPLEIPPDLTSPSRDERYTVPDVSPRGTATFSAYSAERSGTRDATAVEVLPQVDKMRVERSGSQRWLVVAGTPDKLWLNIKDFWQELGFIVNLELPDAGIMETDWAENRAKLPQDVIRATLGKFLDQIYSTPERDKFRTRLEKGAEAGTTEIYISHRGMYEAYADEGKGRTVWQPRPADPELEAEMLRRLMVRLGTEETRAKTLMAADTKKEEKARMVRSAGGVGTLQLLESFDRSWRRVGLALDRVGFTVEDRDRANGLYFVRYVDPEAMDSKKSEGGLLSKLKFWGGGKPAANQQFRILVKGEGGESSVQVLTREGGVDNSETAKKILGLLYDQLK
ncbi:MAG: outer membrane protein assembly factor BamC [Betaproteobacteria bacterium]|nr:outer membrane protein assembly factor BamC [Betaproteobacteria bacterium]